MGVPERRAWMLAHPIVGAALFSGVLAAGGFVVIAVAVSPTAALAASAVGWLAGTLVMGAAMRRAEN